MDKITVVNVVLINMNFYLKNHYFLRNCSILRKIVWHCRNRCNNKNNNKLSFENNQLIILQ